MKEEKILILSLTDYKIKQGSAKETNYNNQIYRNHKQNTGREQQNKNYQIEKANMRRKWIRRWAKEIAYKWYSGHHYEEDI